MATEILESFGALQSELEQAKSSLRGVDENIRRLIGRDPSDVPQRQGAKRGAPNEDKNRQRAPRGRNFAHENEEPAGKRRAGAISVFKRLSERTVQYDDDQHQTLPRQMISKVIVTPKELPSRQEALAAQSKDEQSKARNRRMFGALLGTLQKFQQEETKLKQKEAKRAQLEKKIEEHEIREKEEIKRERQTLFLDRKRKQAEIKMIELKMVRMREQAAWEERQRPRMHFIRTKAKPAIHYLPRKLTDVTRSLLEASKAAVEQAIEQKRKDVTEELRLIEERLTKRANTSAVSVVVVVKNNHNEEEEEEDEEEEPEEADEEDEEMPAVKEEKTDEQPAAEQNGDAGADKCESIEEKQVAETAQSGTP